jgi:hypothetical protein
MKTTFKILGLFLCLNSVLFAQNSATISVTNISPNTTIFGDYGNIDIEPQASIVVEEHYNSYNSGLFISFFNVYGNNNVNVGTWFVIRDANSNAIISSKQFNINMFNGNGYSPDVDRKLHVKAVAYMEFDKLALTGSVMSPTGDEHLFAGTFDISTETFDLVYLPETGSEGTVITRVGGADQAVNYNQFVIAGVKRNYGGNPIHLLFRSLMHLL